ncbi:MAG: hypothetical protein GF398_14335 [Chitinivibrionales bacterium]|nr:hypothetical protein [Chitinivibrionales bacterium]
MLHAFFRRLVGACDRAGKRHVRTIIATTFVGMVPLLFVCAPRALKRIRLLSESAADGDYYAAIKKIRNEKEVYGKINRLLYYYDQGLLFHYMGAFDSSTVYLAETEQIASELYTRSISNEAASLLINDNIRPYRGWRYEIMLLHQLIALNYLAKGLGDEALVESRKLQLVIDAYRQEDKGKDKYHDNGMVHYLSSIAYDMVDEIDNRAISLYKSVSAYHASPLPLPRLVGDEAHTVLLATGRDDDIRELGLGDPDVDSLAENFNDDESEIILVGLAGKAPVLGENVAWGTYIVDGLLILHYRNAEGDMALMRLPAPPLPETEEERKARKEGKKPKKVKSGQTIHVKFAYPSVVSRDAETQRFSLSIDNLDKRATSEMLTDTDVLLRKELEDNRLKIFTRTAIRVVLRTINAQKLKAELATESAAANLLINLGTDALAGQLEKADTRNCFLLPRTVQIARLTVEPGMHNVTALALKSNGGEIERKLWKDVEIGPGEKKFLFYPCLR